MSEKKKNTALNRLEQEMLSEVQALFSKYREKLEKFNNAENNGDAVNMNSTV